MPTLRPAETAARAPARCLHCELPVPAGAPAPYCCRGCEAVHQLIHACDLERYYELRRGRGVPVPEIDRSRRDTSWLDAVDTEIADGGGGARTVALDVQGLHCAGCVWLIERLFRRYPGALRAIVNPARGRVELTVEPRFPVRDFVAEVERFGYLFGPPRKSGRRHSDRLLLRAVVCVVLAGNAMLLSSAVYLGLEGGRLAALFDGLVWLMGLAAVITGAPVFARPALRGLRRGVLSFDLPITAGIALAFAGSTWALTRGAGAVYLDTLAVFLALILLGRWLQERVLENNRDRMLASDGADSLTALRVARGGAVERVPASSLRAGDELVIAPGDVIPVDATAARDAHVSLDWINGESAPRRIAAGAPIPAGAFNTGEASLSARATADFADSPLPELLRAPEPEDTADGRALGGLAQRVAGAYVALVLAAAAVGFAAHLAIAGSATRAIEVATAVLVVTCPCAFGIAAPLAHELALAGLRRAGLFVRRAGFLDRATGVTRVAFDKTGTLTTGTVELADPGALDRLDARERAALYDLAARSSHPRSDAVRRALARFAPALTPGLAVTEVPGRGVETVIDGTRYRLGAPGWAASASSDGAALAFAAGDAPIATFETVETARADAAAETARLAGDGYDLWILSGDDPARVRAAARDLGVAETHALGGLSPDDKADWLAERDRGDTLFVGDGINDSLAAARATCSGTPAIDRPFMAARSDFYFVTPGLAPLSLALRAAARTARVVRRNFAFAVAYNAGAVALAWAGVMRPWLAAVLMPASSLLIVGHTVAALSSRSPLWRS